MQFTLSGLTGPDGQRLLRDVELRPPPASAHAGGPPPKLAVAALIAGAPTRAPALDGGVRLETLRDEKLLAARGRVMRSPLDDTQIENVRTDLSWKVRQL